MLAVLDQDSQAALFVDGALASPVVTLGPAGGPTAVGAAAVNRLGQGHGTAADDAFDGTFHQFAVHEGVLGAEAAAALFAAGPGSTPLEVADAGPFGAAAMALRGNSSGAGAAGVITGSLSLTADSIPLV